MDFGFPIPYLEINEKGTVEFVTRGRFVEVVMGWIANGAKNRQRSPWSMDSPRRPLVDLLGQTQKRPNTEPQGVSEFLD